MLNRDRQVWKLSITKIGPLLFLMSASVKPGVPCVNLLNFLNNRRTTPPLPVGDLWRKKLSAQTFLQWFSMEETTECEGSTSAAHPRFNSMSPLCQELKRTKSELSSSSRPIDIFSRALRRQEKATR